MKLNSIIALIGICISTMAIGQKTSENNEKVNSGFCYVDSLSKTWVYNEICFPEEQNGYSTYTFKSKFEFTLNEKGEKTLSELLSRTADHSKDDKKVKLGSFNANFLSGLTRVKSESNPDEYRVAKGVNQEIEVYYHLGDVVLLFPEIRSDGIKSSYHRIYIQNRCITDFMNSINH